MVIQYSTFYIRRWNRTAEECYKIGCNCQRCPIYEHYFKGSKETCKMKGFVIEMVRRFGITDEMKRKDNIVNEG